MPASRLASANLSRYNVIIIAGNPAMPQATVDRIREWNRAGGTILAYKGGNRWVAGNGFADIKYIDNASRSGTRWSEDIPTGRMTGLCIRSPAQYS